MIENFLQLIQSQSFFYYFFAALLGLIVGSFLNVVILRMPVMLRRSWRIQCYELLEHEQSSNHETTEVFNLIKPRSHCPHCGHSITAFENIPVISYLFLKGRCKQCSSHISIRYPSIEVFTAVLTVITAWKLGVSTQAFLAIILTWTLITLAFIDIDHQLLPDDITLPFLWLGLIASMFGVFTDTHSSIIGAVSGYLSLWLVYHVFKLITGKEGMGYGDFKLLALFGAWLGWQKLPLIILGSSLVGTIIGLGMILFMGRDRQVPIPFGPYLAAAGWITMLCGDDIISSYLSLYTS